MCFSRRAAIRQPRWDTASTHNISVAVGFSFWSHLHLQILHIGSSRRREVAKTTPQLAWTHACGGQEDKEKELYEDANHRKHARVHSFKLRVCTCMSACVRMQHGCFSYPLNKTWISLRSGFKALGRKLFSVTFSLPQATTSPSPTIVARLCHVSV